MPHRLSSHPSAPRIWLRPELTAPWWKIINVLIVMLGVGIISGALYGTKHASGDFYRMLSDRYFIRDAFFESSFLCALLFYLHWRGWKPADFRMHPGWRTSLHGTGLFLLTLASAYLVVHTTFVAAIYLQDTAVGKFLLILLPVSIKVVPGTVHLHWICILGFVILNAFYEELVYMGYAFNQWAQKFGARQAFLFTVALRMGVHIYQGSEHILQIAVWSLLFGLWYWRQGKLWPLVLAHALIDLFSLSLFKLTYGAPHHHS